MFRKLIFGLMALTALGLTFVSQGNASASTGSQRFIVSIDNVGQFRNLQSGVFNTPQGAGSPGPLLPGNAYEWQFNAAPGNYVNFATMFVQSNDWFFGPDEIGIPVYDAAGNANVGDVTHYVKLWDAGTEVDQVPGEGLDQAPRQAGPDTGAADSNGVVRQILSDELPAVNELVKVTIRQNGFQSFTLRIENVSADSSLASPLAPGVGVVHTIPAPLFINGAADWGYGLEALAEDGNPAILAANVAAVTGIGTPLAPAAWLVHEEANKLFASGTVASAGLQILAEDGSPAALIGSLDGYNAGAATIGRGAAGPGPIFAPSGNYTFEITAAPGEHLSLATMFVQSNDWFFGVRNLPLFDADGQPLTGNITNHVRLYDAGTEVDEALGFGANQAPRQAAGNTGANQGGVITPVTTVTPASTIHVTITPVN